jgi:hypothetical protein
MNAGRIMVGVVQCTAAFSIGEEKHMATRRDFVKSAGTAMAGVMGFPALVRAQGSSDVHPQRRRWPDC